MSSVDVEIGTVDFVVPNVVKDELCRLAGFDKAKKDHTVTVTKKKEKRKVR